MNQSDLDPVIREKIRRANRQRFGCAGIVWVFYFGFVLAYAGLVGWFAGAIPPTTFVTWTIVYFYFLIFFCLAVEYVYMRLRASDEEKDS